MAISTEVRFTYPSGNYFFSHDRSSCGAEAQPRPDRVPGLRDVQDVHDGGRLAGDPGPEDLRSLAAILHPQDQVLPSIRKLGSATS